MTETPAEILAEADGLLSDSPVLHLATTSADGPWCAAVYFVHRGRRFYFFSNPDSRHVRELMERPRAAGAVSLDDPDWLLIRGVQFAGTVRPVAGWAEKARAVAAYAAKFPPAERFVARQHGSGRLTAAGLAGLSLFCLDADEMVYLDNRRGFGWRTPLVLED
jgi:uncharacterized protein YhbP (UPF0306 family)